MTPIFPPEIEAEILLRLPAKSLLRFKSVSKSWHFLITSDALFSTSFHRRCNQNPKLFFLKYPTNSLKTPIHFSIASIQSNSIVETITLPLPNDVVSTQSLIPTRVELINSNSVNGIVGIVVYLGFYNGPSDVLCVSYLWNPSTCESFKLPNSEHSGLFNEPPVVKFYSGFGVGIGNAGWDYKVLRVVYTGKVNAMCEVYSIRRNCWKKMCFGLVNSSNTLWASEMCTSVDGFGYWGVYRKERKDMFIVLRFDFSAERFKKIEVPEVCVDGRERKFHSLWEYRGDLALSVLHFGEFESGSSRIYIWVLRGFEGFEHSWSSLFNIDLECGPRRPVMSVVSGEVVLLGEDDDEHVLYDPVNGHVKRVSVCDVDHVLVYVESLVSLRSLLPKEHRSSTDSILPKEHRSSTDSILPKEHRSSTDSILPKEHRSSTDLIDSLRYEEDMMCSRSSRLLGDVPSPHAGGRSASW